MPTKVLIAFDKFKDSLTAERACAICARELQRARPDWSVQAAPLTDGGEGFCRILTEQAGGTVHSVTAAGPRLERVQAPIGILDTDQIPRQVRPLLFLDGQAAPRKIAVIEMAAISGLALLPEEMRDPWKTTSLGTGQLLRSAAEMGAEFAILGIGGSATNDLGVGALGALGLEFKAADGAKIRPAFPETWTRVAQIEGQLFPATPQIAIACDVSNPLLGPEGAAAVYGPQKGLKSDDFQKLEEQASRMANRLCEHFEVDADQTLSIPGTGAAGGISFGFMVAAKAKLVPGIELVTTWLDLERKMEEADIVITGEGRFDQTSLAGKGPGTVYEQARQDGKQAVVFAGAISDNLTGNSDFRAITPPGTPLPTALAQADKNLAQTVSQWLRHC